MKTLLSIFLLIFLTSAAPRPDGCLQLDIMLVGDYSGSVMGSERFIADAFETFGSRFKISEQDIKVGIIIFSDNPSVLCPLTSDPFVLKNSLIVLRATKADPDGMTHITDAMKEAANQLYSNGRHNVRKLIILVSDGLHNGEDGSNGLITTCLMIQKTGIIICTVVIEGDYHNQTLMETVANPGFYVASSYGTLVDQLKSLDVCL